MTALIQIRRDTVANWAANPTLNAGEFGYETDTGNMKIGTGVAWSSTAYLDFSMPARVANSDLNLNTTPGRYYLADMITGVTNAPTGLIAPIALDGQASLWVQTFKDGPPVTVTNIVQMLFSEGAGNAANPPKSWARSYDAGAAVWRDWYPLSSWGVDATNGVELKAATIEAKGTLAVGGVSTLTGAVNVAGAVSVAGILSVTDGTAALPSITNTGDTNTGLSFATADTIVLSTAGAAAVTVGPTGGVTIAGGLAVTGGMSGILDMNSNRITELADPTASTDATNRGWVSGGTIFVRVNMTTSLQTGASASASFGSNWTFTTSGSTAAAIITLTPPIAGLYHGFITVYDSAGNVESATSELFTSSATPATNVGHVLTSGATHAVASIVRIS